MTYWPQLHLTNTEKKRWAVYSDPGQLQRQVMYRAYAAEINITPSASEDIEHIQISRRARIFAMTASGDVHNVEVLLVDSTGEQYTMGYAPLSNLILGTNVDMRGLAPGALLDPEVSNTIYTGQMAGPHAIAPHVFEPNIVLAPNMTFSVRGKALDTKALTTGQKIHVSLVFHVWEFPVE